MPKSDLELRSFPFVALAYVVAPLIGLSAYWLVWAVPSYIGPPVRVVDALSVLSSMLIFGGFICLIVELAIITPLLLAFRRYRWRWLNGWSGALIGFVMGFSFSLGTASLPQPPGSFESGQYGVVYVSNGVLTAAGWREAFLSSLWTGGVGLVGAVAFRLIAVRSIDADRRSRLEIVTTEHPPSTAA
jgi:hypothetical protein